MIYFGRQLDLLTDPKFKAGKNAISVSDAKKEIAIEAGNKLPLLKLTNEYGNSLSYEMSKTQFDSLHAELWRFVKESQH